MPHARKLNSHSPISGHKSLVNRKQQGKSHFRSHLKIMSWFNPLILIKNPVICFLNLGVEKKEGGTETRSVLSL